MITWVELLLCRWGRWAVRRELSAVGYASQSNLMSGMVGRGDGYGSGSPMGISGEDLQACDRAVATLPVVQRAIVIEHYQRQSSVRKTAEACGISPKSVTQYISQAHGMIARHLQSEREVA